MISTVLSYVGAVVVGIISIGLLWLLKFETSRTRRLLRKIPSPKPNHFFLGNALLFMGPREDSFFKAIAEMKRLNHSPVVALWIGPFPRISCLRPEAVEVLLSGTKWLDKAYQYRFLYPWLGFGLLTSTGKKWHQRRKLITPSFHFRILEDFLPIFHEQSQTMVSLIKEKGEDAFDVYPYLLRCTLDIICETAMGTTVRAQGHKDSEYVKAVNFMSQVMKIRSLNPLYFVDFIYAMSFYGRKQKTYLKILHGFTYKVINERRAELKQLENIEGNLKDDGSAVMGMKKRLAFLDMLLGATVDGKPLTDEDVREEVDTFMFEGHDTTSSGVGWILYNLGRFSEMQEKVVEELREFGLLDDANRRDTTEEIKKLKFMECFIKESMRLFPPVPFYGRHLTEDADICGLKIPAGVPITINSFIVHRNPDHFPDPEKFDPDRFLPENSAHRHPYAYVPFSAGPRNCIGQKFALLEEKVLIIHMLRNFKITAIHKIEDIKITAELILRPANGIWLKFENRKLG